MSPNALDNTDAQAIESDGFPSCDGPLFYTLSQSVQDDLTAHFLAMGNVGEHSAPDYGSELLAA